MWQRVLSPDTGEMDPEHEQELRLVAQARAGAAWALSALVARYQPPVVRYLVRLTGSAEPARALAEEVLVRMAKRVRGPRGGEHLRLWLLRACTEVGLEALRRPTRAAPRRLSAGHGPVALLAGRVGEMPVGRWVIGWGARGRATPHPKPEPRTQQFVWQTSAQTPALDGEEHDQLSPREALKYRMVRAVLAELPYGDAQCLSLHLVAGLNQTEVAQALGITPAVARRRVVQGLQLFGRRYDAALASLGLSADFDVAEQEAGDRDELALPTQGALEASTVADAGHAVVPAIPASALEAQPAVVAPAGPPAPPPAVAAARTSAEEAALTSAEIMAYLRAAAARERAAAMATRPPTFVDADPVEAVKPVEHLAPTTHEQPRNAEEPVVEADALPTEPANDDALPPREAHEAADGVIAPWAVDSGELAAQADDRHHIAEAASATMTQTPRLVPVLDPTRPVRIVPVLNPSQLSNAQGEPEDGDVRAPGDEATVIDTSETTPIVALDDQAPGDQPLDAASLSAESDGDEYVLVVEAEPEAEPADAAPADRSLQALRALRARRMHVLSADGEAEDPTDSDIWPLAQ